MSFVKIDLKNAKEPEPVPEGEYDLRIVKVMDTETKKKEPMTVVTLRVEDQGFPNAAAVQEFITYPNGGQYDDLRALQLKRLLTLFDVPFDESGFDSADLMGKTGRCFLTQEEGDDGVLRNKMKLPRIKE